MKLELKHLSAYLPYGLKVIITYYQEKGVMYLEKLSKYKCWLSNGGSVHLWQEQHIDKIKPILRPLSDLTKEIEVNGEKFVPLQYLSININWYSLEQWKSDPKLMNIEEYNNLLSWHFDVFGLIEKGLAININTL